MAKDHIYKIPPAHLVTEHGNITDVAKVLFDKYESRRSITNLIAKKSARQDSIHKRDSMIASDKKYVNSPRDKDLISNSNFEELGPGTEMNQDKTIDSEAVSGSNWKYNKNKTGI